LDWRKSEGEEWTITVVTSDGSTIRLEGGGAKLTIDGTAGPGDVDGEYPGIYAKFVDLIDERQSLVDVAPLRLVADCLLAGRQHSVEAVIA
ncbi:MAG TPA: gfo/Idh/MocA family oxidoreductase, partial [Sphingomicrobium sp.]